MKNRLSSILMTLLIAFPIMSCSLPQGSLEDTIYEPQQKRPHQGVNVSLRKVGLISDVQFSPDGTLLAIATGIGILLYRTKTYDNPEILKGHTGKIRSIAFRPDGKVLASAGQEGTVRLWDVNSRQQIRTFGINLHSTANIAFSPNGKTLASATGADHVDGKEDAMNIYLWDADTGRLLRTLSGHTGIVQDVSFHPDGKILASTCGHSTVCLWNVNTGEQIRTLTGFTDPQVYRSIAFSPDGNTIASSGDRSIHLWDTDTGQYHRIFHSGRYLGPTRDVAFSPDGNTIASIDSIYIHLWDTDTGQYHRRLNKGNYPYPGSDLAFSPDGRTIAGVGGSDAAVWDVQAEELIRVLISWYR